MKIGRQPNNNNYLTNPTSLAHRASAILHPSPSIHHKIWNITSATIESKENTTTPRDNKYSLRKRNSAKNQNQNFPSQTKYTQLLNQRKILNFQKQTAAVIRRGLQFQLPTIKVDFGKNGNLKLKILN